MGVFHRNPAHQNRMVGESLDRAHVTRIRMGRRSFDLADLPVKDAEGERRGAMLEWRDMTVECDLQEAGVAVTKARGGGRFLRARAAGRQDRVHARPRRR